MNEPAGDLKVIGLDGKGRLMTDNGKDGVARWRLFIAPNGTVRADLEPDEKFEPTAVDQIGSTKKTSVAERLAHVDQG